MDYVEKMRGVNDRSDYVRQKYMSPTSENKY